MTPEQRARIDIDRLLSAAGWQIQDLKDFNRKATLGVAVREFSLNSGSCDYLLFVDGKAAGVIEAKKFGVTLSGVADQSQRYMGGLPEYLAKWDDLLVFDYESTSEETFFRNTRDPKPRSRRVFAFHKPETLHTWLKAPRTLRAALSDMPPLDETGLRDCQIEPTHR
ncbi:MAG: restriction endonuclease subunit R, partial [Paracoccaceae bacterium]